MLLDEWIARFPRLFAIVIAGFSSPLLVGAETSVARSWVDAMREHRGRVRGLSPRIETPHPILAARGSPSPTRGEGKKQRMTAESAAGRSVALSQHAHDVALLHDQEFLAVELDFGARPFAEQHAVADPKVDRDQLAGFVAAARAYRGDFALRGLFLGAVGNDDAALGFFFGVDTLDQ